MDVTPRARTWDIELHSLQIIIDIDLAGDPQSVVKLRTGWVAIPHALTRGKVGKAVRGPLNRAL